MAKSAIIRTKNPQNIVKSTINDVLRRFDRRGGTYKLTDSITIIIKYTAFESFATYIGHYGVWQASITKRGNSGEPWKLLPIDAASFIARHS